VADGGRCRRGLMVGRRTTGGDGARRAVNADRGAHRSRRGDRIVPRTPADTATVVGVVETGQRRSRTEELEAHDDDD